MSEGIIIQLQAEAIGENSNIETLLRKAYLVARKLHLKDFEEWISCEQNGYSKKDVPDYRMIGGTIKAHNPYYGWTTLVMDGKWADEINKMPMKNPIAAVISLYESGDETFGLAVPGEVSEFLNQNTSGFPTNYGFFSSKAELRKIISAVRNKILEWALLLEEHGIVGEGLTFTDTEIKTASESKVINNYTNNFYSESDGAQIQQGGSNNNQ